MKEDWLSNGDANSKTKEMLLSQFKCETAYSTTSGLIVSQMPGPEQEKEEG
jgi:hypothetical protein